MVSKSLQQLYTQLPQSLSDSDSEKESNDKQDDDIKIIQHETRPIPRGPMSPLRKTLFVLSIALCFIVVVVFLWVLPCSENSVCQSVIGNWKKEFEGFAFEGPISIVRHNGGKSLRFLFKVRNKNSHDVYNQDGILAIQSSTGETAWFLPQIGVPKQVSCELMDLNGDQIKDCFLLGEQGLLVVDPITSNTIWYAHNKNTVVRGLDFPILLPDLNADGVPDLLTVSNSNSYHNKIAILCGQTGRILTEILVHNCESIEHFNYKPLEKLVIINCWNITNKFFKIALKDLQRRIFNASTLVQATTIKDFTVNTHANNFTINNHKLVIGNHGECPNCIADIILKNLDTRKQLLNWTRNHTFVAKPIAYSFKTNKNIPMYFNGQLNGFILKLWEWQAKPKIAEKKKNRTERNLLSERVLLILFSETEVQVINVSYTEITQLCFNSDDCQPSIAAHNESILLTDLDRDGHLELINYCTSYKCSSNASTKNCLLTSKVEVIKLETEMPKLFLK